jgi:HemK-related putative methylase
MVQRTWTSYQASNQGWWQPFLRALARIWLTFRYQVLDRRHGRLVVETIDGVPLIVLPGVFNPALFRSGEFMARVIAGRQLPLGARVLDLGTGSGVGAIFAARQGAQVTAVDINPEAVRCAQINALLNDLAGRINVVEGDLFAPVVDQRFDLILFNPPYYRGRPADDPDHAWRSQDIFERFASGLASHLASGGRGLIVLSSDGDGDQLLALLEQAEFAVRPLASKNLINEVLTIYELYPGFTSRNGLKTRAT